MNGCYHLGKVLTSFILAVVSGTALAGELGRSSRENVSITVTIPQRFHVQSLPSVKADNPPNGESVSRQICVSSSGRQFTYRMIPANAGDSKEASPSGLAGTMDRFGPPDGDCRLHERGSDAAKLTIEVGAGSKRSLTDLAEPAILLIAPE